MTIANYSFKAESLREKGLINDAGYVNLTIQLNDSVSEYGQNVQAYLYQNGEERKSKKPRVFLGGGKTVFSTDENIYVPPRS